MVVPRRLLARLLIVLLLGMQQFGQWHAIQHLGDALERLHEQGVSAQQPDDPCAVCELLAGGSNAAPATAIVQPGSPARFAALVPPGFPAAAESTPSPYQSRAPPANS